VSVGLYVCSMSHFSGKTAVCVGLGRRLIRDGFSFGYLKPISVLDQLRQADSVDEDVRLLAKFSGQEALIEQMAPVRLNAQELDHVLLNEELCGQYLRRLREAYESICQERDVVILEGGGSLWEGSVINFSASSLAQALGVPVLVVVKYVTDLQVVDDALAAQSVLGDTLLGVILNVVPPQRKSALERAVVPAIRRRGVMVFAVLLEDMLLKAISVGEMARALQAEVLCAVQNQDELVENLMVGAMNVDAALSYFRRKPNKAVFTGGDRLDIQLAALETSTRCLVLTGNLPPSPVILSRAEETGVPVVWAKQDTLTAVETIENHFGKTRFHHQKKIDAFESMLEDCFNFEALYASLHLSPAQR